MPRQAHFVFPLYPGVTQLDFTGPHQFFSRMPGAKVTTASLAGQAITADGLVFAGLEDLCRIDDCDVLCVPGGNGTAEAVLNERYMAEIARLAAQSTYITSVCTGSLVLGAAGLLQGKRATSHWAWRDLLPQFGAILTPGRVVRDGNIFTAGGVTAGIDFGLVIVAELAGAEAAQMVQLGLEYAPAPPFESGHPDIAPAGILADVRGRVLATGHERRRAIAEAAARLRWQTTPPMLRTAETALLS